MFMKTMMVGYVAGEAQLDDGSDAERSANAQLSACAIEKHVQALGARLIVLKEFPYSYRGMLACFEHIGFTRIPSMPLTRLSIARIVLPWLEPTRYDKTLKKFPNYKELYDSAESNC